MDSSAKQQQQQGTNRPTAAKETMKILEEISGLLNTGLDKESLGICVEMLENGVNPEALAAVIKELRRESQAIRSLLGLNTNPCDVRITLSEEDHRKKIESRTGRDKVEQFPLYFDGEPLIGKVQIRARDGKRVEHNGIKVEFVGQIVMFNDRGNHYEFLALQKELSVAGELKHTVAYDFEFKNVEKQYECYQGTNVKLRYFIRVTIARRLSDIVSEKDIWVYSYKIPPEINDSIKMEVGIEDCLHIEFEYSKYSLKDVIVGKIYFLLVRIKIRNMELSIIRRESTGAGSSTHNDNETVTKFEIMDGAPVRGETIPIRLFLGGNGALTPTFREVNKKFSTRYYLNLVLVDEENRRYFKQQEITLYRLQAPDEVPLHKLVAQSPLEQPE